MLVLLVILVGCQRGPSLPDPASETYQEVVSAFYTGLAAMQVGEEVFAEGEFTRVTELASQEPAAWANLGLLALRRNDLDLAGQHLEQARALAPDNSHIQYLSGLLADAQGRTDDAAAYFRRAVALAPTNLKALYALAQQVERQGGADGVTAARGLLDTLLAARPTNVAVLLEQARLAAEQNDRTAVQETLARLAEQADAWPPSVRQQVQAVQAVATDAQQAATEIAFLQNLLKQVPSYREDLAVIQTPVAQPGVPLAYFVRLPSPSPQPAPRDDSLRFVVDSLPAAAASDRWAWVGAFLLTDEAPPVVVGADGQQVWVDTSTVLPFPGGPSATPPAPHGIAGVDYNYDFQVDLVVAGTGGFRLFQQEAMGTFVDVTDQLGLPAAITQAAYTGAWGADFDMEGDIDLILASPDGPPQVLRNNGDGTFSPWGLFEDILGLQGFAWADVDADGDPDAAFLDRSGRLHVLENRRASTFQPFATPPPPLEARAVAMADVNSDGLIDLVLLGADGTVHQLSREGDAWTDVEIASWNNLPGGLDLGTAQLFVADLDNNGGLDLLAAGSAGAQAWLSDQEGVFHPLDAAVDAHVVDVADLEGEGRLDLLGVSAAGRPLILVNQGGQPYHARSIRPRAATVLGDQRINPFGIGGEVEIRSGLLFQKQPITGPVVHFGLGEHPRADVARIVWPNGDVQAEFNLESDLTVLTRQRLKGSCPWLFTYDGRGMQFVTDFLWRSPLGLAINAQETAGIMTTEDWVKIRGDQLVPRAGVYDVRITAELWETHFFDHVSLMVVDHPVGTEVYVDERFAFPPPAPAVHPTAPPRPVARAWDDQGREVTDRVAARDEQYLGGFALGPYQGVAQDHYVEVDLGADVPEEGLVLLASGWVRPTDSSINVAISQGDHAPPEGLSVEVPDGAGGWTAAQEGLGFPAGKAKTILIDLEGIFPPGTPRRLRLRTNLEVYWDALAWTTRLPETALRTERLLSTTAELRYRGFSEVTEANRASPELPDYDRLVGTVQVWRDLIGYYTRFGEVRELLTTVDDRYVIMNAGDELALHFPVPAPPPEGWTRDFVLIGDGWVKDGDYNTTFSKTVLPLPSHDQPAYDTLLGRLEEDPVYRRHPQDWRTYHTRYVTPAFFHRALHVK